ncbi:MAG: gephyrin-like molybdotransferase Glp [Pseudomonadota bacterium]
MLAVAVALERLFTLVPPPRAETVALEAACGRVLLEDAVAQRAQPPFAASAMDGYAVRAAEAAAGATLSVAGEAAAGHAFTGALPPGSAVRIFTGAPVPEGADAILIQENATREGNHLRVDEAPPQGAYIRPAGGDFAAGARLSAPRRLTARDLALLAAMNVAEVQVARRPEIALIPTGDELVHPGETPRADQIVASNNIGLAARLTEVGALARPCPIARDNRASLLAALEAARGADIVVTLGGASVGDHDLVAEVYGEAGLTLDFYKIAMRPGKPLMAGRLGEAMMLGLPGNPVSALVCGEIFLLPCVEAALGLPAQPRALAKARLAHDLPANGPREHYMRAVVRGVGREAEAEVFENQDSSLLATLSRANALIVRAPHAGAAAWGDVVPFMPL